MQHAVGEAHILWLAGLVLHFLVPPAADPGVGVVTAKSVSQVVVPLRRIEAFVVKLVALKQLSRVPGARLASVQRHTPNPYEPKRRRPANGGQQHTSSDSGKLLKVD